MMSNRRVFPPATSDGEQLGNILYRFGLPSATTLTNMRLPSSALTLLRNHKNRAPTPPGHALPAHNPGPTRQAVQRVIDKLLVLDPTARLTAAAAADALARIRDSVGGAPREG